MVDPKERKIIIRDRLRVAAVFAVLLMVIAFIVYFGMVAMGRLPIPRWPRPDKEAPAPAVTAEPAPTPTEEPVPTASAAPVPSAKPSPERAEASEEAVPVEERSPTPTAEPTPIPTAEPTPEPTAAPLRSALWTDGKTEAILPVTLRTPGQRRWQYQISNAELLLEEDYAPQELVWVESGQAVDRRMEAPLRQMFAEARRVGYSLYFCSGYRDYETQSIIYWNHIYDYEAQGLSFEEADALTCLAVNPPGASEHQLGLTADVLEYAGQPMIADIGGSGLMAWLEKNCARFGFIVRYPEGKTDITGVDYEPWHLRYVGSAAAYIMENDLCLEEFLALYNERKNPPAAEAEPEEAPAMAPETEHIRGKS